MVLRGAGAAVLAEEGPLPDARAEDAQRHGGGSDAARDRRSQGEDRWLCTLLLQRGYRVEYSAASDAYTHCPTGFNEFFNQRRRWVPSTIANIFDLLRNYKATVKINENISLPYIFYQAMLMTGTIIGPGTIFLMLVVPL